MSLKWFIFYCFDSLTNNLICYRFTLFIDIAALKQRNKGRSRSFEQRAGIQNFVKDTLTDKVISSSKEFNDGWRTLYGHLKRESLMVQKGDTVTSGQKLGDIGLSGLTQFPHVHFQVQYLGQTTDPFTGLQRFSLCEDTENNLWSEDAFEQVIYQSGFLLDYGVNDQPPVSYRDIESGEFNQGTNDDSENLFTWVRFIGLPAGSQVTLSITSPDGETVKSKTFDKLKTSKAQNFYYMGIPNPVDQPGSWQAEVILKRPSQPKSRQVFSYTVDAVED